MRGQVVILRGLEQRALACKLVRVAPDMSTVNIAAPQRTLDQNAKMWAMLSDLARAKPEGRRWTKDAWKAAHMHLLGHQVIFCEGLDDSGPFPIGFKSSALNKRQMADLITSIYEYGDRHGVQWSEPNPYAETTA